MKHKGFSHIGLSTLDQTRAFYEGVLGSSRLSPTR